MTVEHSIRELEELIAEPGMDLTIDQIKALGLATVVLKAMPDKEVELVDMVMCWTAKDTR